VDVCFDFSKQSRVLTYFVHSFSCTKANEVVFFTGTIRPNSRQKKRNDRGKRQTQWVVFFAGKKDDNKPQSSFGYLLHTMAEQNTSERLNSLMDELTTEMGKAEAMSGQLSTAIQKLMNQLAQLKAEATELRATITQTEQQLTTHSSQSDEELANLRAKLGELVLRLKTNTAKQESLVTQIDQHQAALGQRPSGSGTTGGCPTRRKRPVRGRRVPTPRRRLGKRPLRRSTRRRIRKRVYGR
jgi:endonuclease III